LKARTDFFLAAAAECRAAAQSARDSAIKQAYLELAQGWHALADQMESFRSRTFAGAKSDAALRRKGGGYRSRLARNDAAMRML
jgi:hypothetical protein